MANPFERCSSVWKVPDVLRTVVRCDRWGDHAGEHRGFDSQDMACRWSDEHVPWNQPVPDNLEVDKTVTAEDHRADDEQVLRIGQLEKLVEEWEGRVAGLIEANRRLMCERDDAIHARDVEARNAVGLLRKLEQVRALTNGVPTHADA